MIDKLIDDVIVELKQNKEEEITFCKFFFTYLYPMDKSLEYIEALEAVRNHKGIECRKSGLVEFVKLK